MTTTTACFDLDGCLVDSTRPILEAITASLAELGLPAQDTARLHEFIGPPLRESYVRLLEDLGEDPRVADDLVASYREVYGPLSLELTQVVDGIEGLLEHLDCRLLVVTSKPTHFAVPIVEQVGLAAHFEAVHGPDLDALEEPKATTLATALSSAGVQPGREVTMIGDRRHDVAAGIAHGCTTVGVTWGAGDRAELTAAGADVVVDTVDQLASQLR